MQSSAYPGYFYIFDMDGLDFATATDKKGKKKYLSHHSIIYSKILKETEISFLFELGIETMIRILKIFQNYYPDRLKTVYIINGKYIICTLLRYASYNRPLNCIWLLDCCKPDSRIEQLKASPTHPVSALEIWGSYAKHMLPMLSQKK